LIVQSTTGTDEPREIGLRDAAERLEVHYMTAYRYVRSGRLPARKDGGEWRVLEEDLARLTSGTDADTPVAAGPASRARQRAGLEARLVAGDEAGAWGVCDAALNAGASPSKVLLELLAPSLASIGSRWAAGELTIAHEHQATAVASRIIGRLGPRFARRGRKRGTVIVGAAAGDRHALAPAILADLLRGAGFDVLDLGADTPAESFEMSASNASQLVGVVVSVTSDDGLDGASEAARLLRRSLPDTPVFIGGGAVASAAQAMSLGSSRYCDDGPGVVAALEVSLAGAGA